MDSQLENVLICQVLPVARNIVKELAGIRAALERLATPPASYGDVEDNVSAVEAKAWVDSEGAAYEARELPCRQVYPHPRHLHQEIAPEVWGWCPGVKPGVEEEKDAGE